MSPRKTKGPNPKRPPAEYIQQLQRGNERDYLRLVLIEAVQQYTADGGTQTAIIRAYNQATGSDYNVSNLNRIMTGKGWKSGDPGVPEPVQDAISLATGVPLATYWQEAARRSLQARQRRERRRQNRQGE